MLVTLPYDRAHAVEYALSWALARNPLFGDFSRLGGDCTSFVSQSVLAGSCIMNGTPDFGWYYRSLNDRAPAWSGVEFFWSFMTGAPDFVAQNGGTGPFGREVGRRAVMLGDVVQLGDAEGDFYHTLIITSFSGSEILVSAHTNDAKNRPLSDYDYAAVRFLHIEGVRFELPQPQCFEGLLNGTVLPPA